MTWTYISGPALESASEVAPKQQLTAPSLTLAPVVPAPIPRTPVALDVVGTDDGLRPAGSAVRWEMMVPKMTRPPARPVASLSAGAATLRRLWLPASKTHRSRSPQHPFASNRPPAYLDPICDDGPDHSLHTPEDQFVAHYWPPLAFASDRSQSWRSALLIWVDYPGKEASSTAKRTAPHSFRRSDDAASWSHQPVSSSGRSLIVYEPSRAESDYRMEFHWVPDAAGVGWVFRTRDENNYYAARLSLLQRGANGVLMAEHFSVSEGTRESAHSRKK